MEKLKSITIIFLLAFGLLSSVAPAKTTSVLLQEGLYAEEIKGDLDAAIKIYEQVITESKEFQRAAAQATYRIGMCYLKKGQKDKAAEYFQNIISDFPSQKVIVRKAEQQLDKIKSRAERIVEQAVMTISTCAEGDPRVAEALESLKGLDENVVVNELVKFLNSEADTARRSAIYILWKGDLKEVSAAVPALKKLCSHKEDITRGMAAITLGAAKIKPSFETLANMTLEDPSGYARRCAAYALGLMGNANAKPILEKALEDSDPLVCNNAKAALAMLSEKIRASARSFGPVMERVINDDGEGEDFMFDLDIGKSFSVLDAKKWGDAPDISEKKSLEDFVMKSGIDLFGETSKKSLMGIDMIAIPIHNERWDMSPEDVIEQVSLGKPGTPVALSADGQLPKTFVFKTGQGGMGILQIIEMQAVKAPRHFKIRYKMLQKVPADIKAKDQELQERAESAGKLKKLGLASAMFANEHNSKLPDNLQELEPYIGKKQDFQWILENVEYLGKGKKVVGSLRFTTIIAYDKTLLVEGKGTNVLFGDSHVEFKVPEKLKELGITTKTPGTTLESIHR
jgi:prepilin-type processing-associated H-X9-DG protein